MKRGSPTIDGFVDNEYGFIKFRAKRLEEGNSIKPHGFTLVWLEEIMDDWFYWASS